MEDPFITRVVEGMTPILQRSIVPISAFYKDYNRLCAYGTGTLLAVGERRFLVTAAHVWMTAQDEDRHLYTTNFGVETPTVSLSGSEAVYFNQRILDVAIIELATSVIKGLTERHFLNLGYVGFGQDAPGARYYVYGWPCELSQDHPRSKTLEASPMHFLTRGSVEVAPPDAKFDPELHLLLRIPREDRGGVPLRGAPSARPGRLNGLSGSSLWRVCRSDDEIPNWTPATARIIAVQSSALYEDHRVIKGIRWRCVAALLWHLDTTLRSIMEIAHPMLGEEIERLGRYLLKYVDLNEAQ